MSNIPKPIMTSAKERFDSLSILYARAWKNFNDRRKIEFKLSYSLYTLFCFAIAGLVLYIDKLPGEYIIPIGIGFFGICLVLFHFLWCRKANKTNFLDRQIAIHYEKIMQEISESKFQKGILSLIDENYMHKKKQESKEESKEELKYPSILKNWSMMIQLLISVCLFSVLLLLAYIQFKT
jgi:hypothetical protein